MQVWIGLLLFIILFPFNCIDSKIIMGNIRKRCVHSLLMRMNVHVYCTYCMNVHIYYIHCMHRTYNFSRQYLFTHISQCLMHPLLQKMLCTCIYIYVYIFIQFIFLLKLKDILILIKSFIFYNVFFFFFN